MRLLVLLPSKYCSGPEIPNHTNSPIRRNWLTACDQALLDSWREAGILYECAPRLYDDWYWLYATVAETSAGEWSGVEVPLGGRLTRVVTNDGMHDHWVDLLSALSWRRWKFSQVCLRSPTRP